jgi:hypothetical protein
MSIQQIKSGVIADDAVTAEKVSEGAPYWDASGNVGIGTDSPAQALDVVGSVKSSGAFRADGGSAAAPAFTFDGDPDGGMFRPSVNTIAFATLGAERMRIDNSGNLLFNSGYGSVATAYGCRAWVHFTGSGTPSINGSGNISSITDVNTGRYTVNLTTAMPDANYAVAVGMEHITASAPNARYAGVMNGTVASGSVGIHTGFYTSSHVYEDPPSVFVSIFR